jgi:serine/threonine protein kinase
VIGFSALVCPGCGASLPPEALLSVVTCTFCGASVTCDETSVSSAGFRRALADQDDNPSGEARTWIGGLPYRVLTKIAAGKHADVLLAERARRITERVVIKKARKAEDVPRIERSWDALARLRASTVSGAEHFTQRLPQLVAHGVAKADDDDPRHAIVYRYTSGFVHTFEDVRREYPSGIDGRHAVWMWRRILELLTFVHKNGIAHGALTPDHLLVHARDHGVMPIGWSEARYFDAHENAFGDIVESARSIVYVLGGRDDRLPKSVAPEIAELVTTFAGPDPGAYVDDAWALREALGRAAHRAYGPNKYHYFAMPGWRR